MRPLREWLAVRREKVEGRSPLWLPGVDQADCLIGEVVAVGSGAQRKHARIPIEARPGDRVCYSSRVDTYKPGDVAVDVVSEQSIIGWL